MRTDDLIRQLAAEPSAPRPWPLGARLAVAAAVGTAFVAALVIAGIGVRPDLGGALSTPAGALKTAGGVAIAAAAFRIACRLGQPGARPVCPLGAALLLVPVAAAFVAFAGSGDGFRIAVPVAFALSCVEKIFLLALLPLGAALLALRSGAPTRPAAAGAAAGLLAGGLAAGGFALSCPIDDPGFVAAGYGAAILLVSAVGALAGGRLLAW